jgi:SulP family sulfate permease
MRLRLPCVDWLAVYDRDTFARDALAAVIVTIMLIPQSLAYASLAGLPPETGLYASIAPLVLYAMFGTSRVLAVGPVAVVSLMTAAAIGDLAAAGTPRYHEAAIVLALMSGAMLLAMGLLRLGFLANFLSHPVISGFVTASALLIAAGQLEVILGVKTGAGDFVGMIVGMVRRAPEIHLPTAAIGLGALAALAWARRGLKPLLRRVGLGPRLADVGSKAAPVGVIALTALLSWRLEGAAHGVAIVGTVPSGLPPVSWPGFDPALWASLALPALLIAVVGFVESVSVGQTLAARRRQRIEPDRELVALGASNLGAGLSGGFPVTGGFSRSVVNFDAGAQTPAAGVLTAVGILAAALLLTPALYHVPKATLAATIVVAVLALVDLGLLRRTWAHARGDFAAALATIAVTLGHGIESGLIAGVLVSLLLFLFRSSRPHIAEVGQVPGTEHFRNVLRHDVIVSPAVLGLRVDESLWFANARALEDRINEEVARRPALRHVVLLCSAVNDVDASAIESLEAIDRRLKDAGILLHLSEVKGPVMDRLQRTALLAHLHGRVFLSHFQAMHELAPDLFGPAGAQVGPGGTAARTPVTDHPGHAQ